MYNTNPNDLNKHIQSLLLKKQEIFHNPPKIELRATLTLIEMEREFYRLLKKNNQKRIRGVWGKLRTGFVLNERGCACWILGDAFFNRGGVPLRLFFERQSP